MPIGPVVRRLFGRHEHRVSALWRSIFVDIDEYIRRIAAWGGSPRTILEVGCGEGAVTERLAQLYPDAAITAIDISPRLGRLYRGPCERVRFVETTIQAVAATQPKSFDLVVLSDVLHHVPDPQRAGFLAALHATIRPGGLLVFKDWENRGNPIHWLSHAADRWLTGDRVRYLRGDELDHVLVPAFGPSACVDTARIGPWRNNFAILARA